MVAPCSCARPASNGSVSEATICMYLKRSPPRHKKMRLRRFFQGYRFIPSRVDSMLFSYGPGGSSGSGSAESVVALAACIIPAIVLPLGAAILLGLPLAPVVRPHRKRLSHRVRVDPHRYRPWPPCRLCLLRCNSHRGRESSWGSTVSSMLSVIHRNALQGSFHGSMPLPTQSRMFDRYCILGLFPCEILVGVIILRTGLLALWVERRQGRLRSRWPAILLPGS